MWASSPMNGNGNTRPLASSGGATSTHSWPTLTCALRLTRHTPVGALPDFSLMLARRTCVPLGRTARRAFVASFPPHHLDSGAWIPVMRTRMVRPSDVMSNVSPSITRTTSPDSRHFSAPAFAARVAASASRAPWLGGCEVAGASARARRGRPPSATPTARWRACPPSGQPLLQAREAGSELLGQGSGPSQRAGDRRRVLGQADQGGRAADRSSASAATRPAADVLAASACSQGLGGLGLRVVGLGQGGLGILQAHEAVGGSVLDEDHPRMRGTLRDRRHLPRREALLPCRRRPRFAFSAAAAARWTAVAAFSAAAELIETGLGPGHGRLGAVVLRPCGPLCRTGGGVGGARRAPPGRCR